MQYVTDTVDNRYGQKLGVVHRGGLRSLSLMSVGLLAWQVVLTIR